MTGQGEVMQKVFVEGSLKNKNRALSAWVGGESLQTPSWKCFFLNSLGIEPTYEAE